MDELNKHGLIPIFFTGILLLSLFSLTGCVGGKETQKPGEVVKAFISELNQGNFQAAAQYMTEEKAQQIENASQSEMSKAKQTMQNMEISITEIQDKSIQEDSATVTVEMEASAKGQTQTITTTFDLVKENGEWKIKQGMQDIAGKGTGEDNYEDVCFSTYQSYQKNPTTEWQSKVQTCYQGKYYDYAVDIENVSHCNQIIPSARLARCYAYYYQQTGEEVCKDIPIEYYTTQGYYEDLSTKDVCYMTYASLKVSENTYSTPEESFFNETCGKIKNEQVKSKCWDMYSEQ